MQQESLVLKQIKELFQQQGVGPEHVEEAFCAKDKFDSLKNQFRKKYGRSCSFFTKDTGKEIHIIILISITGLEKFAREFQEATGYSLNEALDKSSFSNLKSSAYSPVIKFSGMENFGQALNKAKSNSDNSTSSISPEVKEKPKGIQRIKSVKKSLS